MKGLNMPDDPEPSDPLPKASPAIDVLNEIQWRVLWLATRMIDAANRRPNLDGIKVGGHQASSASMVTAMTALYFEHLDAQDRVAVKPHESRRGWQGPHCDGVLRLVTNRLDLPAELIAEMYRLRWFIEMFFRTFKQLLGCRHLLSDKHNGVEIQAYCAMIVCMLILIYTGNPEPRKT